jgi:ABC-type transporter Mla MlaB component
MTQRMQCQIEMVGETATLYVSGALGRENIETLIAVSVGMPARIRTLRVDLHALGQLTAGAMSAIRALLAHWRESRHGEFRLSTAHLTATLRDVAEARAPGEPNFRPSYEPSGRARVNDALVATFL